MKRTTLLVAAAAIFILPAMARAQVVDDPLHGEFCANPNCTGTPTNPDTGSFGPATNAQLDAGFGWSVTGSGATGATGNLMMVLLAPTGDGFDPTQVSITGTKITGSANFTAYINSGLGTGTWTETNAKTLEDFLGLDAQPTNSWGGMTPGLDTSVTGFNVYTLTIDDVHLANQGDPLNDFYKFAGLLPAGVEIVGYLNTGSQIFATANSEQLQVQPDPVPAPIVGAGLPGLIAAGLALVKFARRRRKQRVGLA
jgi:hypothetical protein